MCRLSFQAQIIDFEKRTRRPPENMLNALISFINILVYTTIVSEIYHTQLSPTISYLYQPGERRFSLSLDISEVFKPLLADRLIFMVLNKKVITEDDFVKELNYVYIKYTARKEIVRYYDERLLKTIYHKKLGKDVSYHQLIRLELYKLVKHLTNEVVYEGV